MALLSGLPTARPAAGVRPVVGVRPVSGHAAVRSQRLSLTQRAARDPSPASSGARRRLAAAVLGGLVAAGGARRRARAAPAAPPAAPRAGLVALVTGGNTGIGKATVAGLAASGQYGTIFLAGHNEEKTRAAMAQVAAGLPSGGGGAVRLEYLPLELSSLASVRAAAKAFQEKQLPLHTLICNAAVMALPERRVTGDGLEYQFEVNYLGHFLLCNLLYPQLKAAGRPDEPARIVSVSSSAHFVKSPLGFGDASDLNLSGGEGDVHAYYPWTAYGQSKLAQVMFTYELDRRLQALGDPVTANVLDPGFVDTELQRNLSTGAAPSEVMKFIAKTPQKGAETPVLLATAGLDKVGSGGYWADSKQQESLGRGPSPMPMSSELAVKGTTSYDTKTWRDLWDASCKLSGLRDSESVRG